MIRTYGKKMILWMLAVLLCLTGAVPAFASTGDRILIRSNSSDGFVDNSVQGVFRMGDGFCIVTRGQSERTILRYADIGSEPETFVLAEIENVNNFEPDENGEYAFTNEYISSLFCRDGELYALVEKNVSGDNYNRVEQVAVRHLKLEDGKAVLEDSGLPNLEVDEILEGDEDYQYFNGLEKLYTQGNTLTGLGYNENGRVLVTFDLTTGACTPLELGSSGDGDVADAVPGPEGSVLIVRIEYGEGSGGTSIIRMNPADGSEETVWKKENDYLYSMNPCYDAETDTLYYGYAGELWAMPGLDAEKAEAVNDCPDCNGALIVNGGFLLLWNYDTVMLRNTDPAQRGSIKLRIRDNSYSSAISQTIYDMNDKRGDVSVVLQQEWNMQSDILQAMMNRDGYTDIYALEYHGNDFSALRSRGFLMDLSGNEQIAAAVDRMYPYLQDAVKQDGKIIGVPVFFSGRTLGINLDIWEKMGHTEDELPKTWDQFFDWLETVPEVLAGQETSLVGTWEDRLTVRASMIDMILTQYQVLMDGKGENYVFNSPLLNGLLTRLNSIDYDALGIRDYEEGDDGGYEYSEEYHEPLLELYFDSTMTGYDSRFVPMILSLADGEDPVLPVEINVAFVNPYSEHPQEAMEYLALAMNNLDIYARYTAFADMTEPVRYPYYEENLKSWQESLDELRKEYETAEGDMKTSLEESIRDYEQILEEQERYSWSISQRDIERYQQRQSALRVQGYSFIYDMMRSSQNEEEKNEYYDMIYGAENFSMSPDELLTTIDRKIQMMRLEGN